MTRPATTSSGMASVEAAFAARVADAQRRADFWEREHKEALAKGDVAYARTAEAIYVNKRLAALTIPFEVEDDVCLDCGDHTDDCVCWMREVDADGRRHEL